MIWIFDLDGTLVKSSKSARRACEQILDRPLDFETSGLTDGQMIVRTGVDEHAFVEMCRSFDPPEPIEATATILAAICKTDTVALLTGNLMPVALHKLRNIHSVFDFYQYSELSYGKLDLARLLDIKMTELRIQQPRVMVGDKDIDKECAHVLNASFIRVEDLR